MDSLNSKSGIIINNVSLVVVTIATPEHKEFFLWYYKMSVFNSNKYPVQLITCHWIVDNCGTTIKIKDMEMMKQKPVVHPLEIFEHGSYVTLETSGGIICGSYEFLNNESRSILKISSPPFLLGQDSDSKRFH